MRLHQMPYNFANRGSAARPPGALPRDKSFMRSALAGPAVLRVIAAFEAAKGLMVLLLGLGTLRLLHGNAEATAETLLIHLHLNPDSRVSHALLDAATHVTDARLWGVVAGAFAYTGVHFTEAWGLWRRRTWAQWFALLSAAMYLPWEVVECVDRRSWLHVSLLLVNLAILLYMFITRVRASCAMSRERLESPTGERRSIPPDNGVLMAASPREQQESP